MLHVIMLFAAILAPSIAAAFIGYIATGSAIVSALSGVGALILLSTLARDW